MMVFHKKFFLSYRLTKQYLKALLYFTKDF